MFTICCTYYLKYMTWLKETKKKSQSLTEKCANKTIQNDQQCNTDASEIKYCNILMLILCTHNFELHPRKDKVHAVLAK